MHAVSICAGEQCNRNRNQEAWTKTICIQLRPVSYDRQPIYQRATIKSIPKWATKWHNLNRESGIFSFHSKFANKVIVWKQIIKSVRLNCPRSVFFFQRTVFDKMCKSVENEKRNDHVKRFSRQRKTQLFPFCLGGRVFCKLKLNRTENRPSKCHSKREIKPFKNALRKRTKETNVFVSTTVVQQW